jgi:hypothetical protein
MSTTFQSGALATPPAGLSVAVDRIGTGTPPTAGDDVQYMKLDVGAAGASSPVTSANPMPVSATTRGGTKGVTPAADVTSTAEGTDHQALDVQLYHGGAAIDPRVVADAALAALLGSLSDTPGAYTVLDRLNAIGRKIDASAKVGATEATMQKVLGALTKPPATSAVRATLSHRF